MNITYHIKRVNHFFQKYISGSQKSSLKNRVFSIFLLYPFVFLALFLGGSAFNIFIFIFSIFLAYEWISVSDPKADEVSYLRYFSLIALSLFFASINYWSVAFIILLGGVVFLGYGRYRRELKVWHTIFGLFYIIGACWALIWIRKQGLFPTLFLFGSVISADTVAYSMGSWLKGPKICPVISPNKTWAGALSALIFSPVVAVILAVLFGVLISYSILLSALILAVSAVIGDLAESWFKRKFGVKDTGNILPGHGGVWDRADALLFSSLIFVFLNFIGLFSFSGLHYG